jgi:type I restriction-modification system DNA methylase subunit
LELKELCDKTCAIFEVESVKQLGDAMMLCVRNNDAEKYAAFSEMVMDMSIDWMQKIFQYYEADRKEKMQDYTPLTVAKLVGKLAETDNEKTVYDLCAGSGALTIQKWNLNHELKFVCYEYDKKVIPYLLFNLAVRNIEALVINGDALQDEVFTRYKVRKGEQFCTVEEIEEPVQYEIADCCISNPPYNMKWAHPPFAQIQPRFYDFTLPPENNANFAFVLSGLYQSKNKAVFVLPSVEPSNKAELEIRKELVEYNLIEAVVSCPGKMFESTDIAVSILVLNRNKPTTHIELVDMREVHEVEVREQRGQYGSTSHTQRVYKKEVNIFSDEQISRALSAIAEQKNENGFCRNVSLEEVREHQYTLNPSAYFEVSPDFETPHREFGDIVDDLNYVINEKNALRLTVNEKLAKALGLYDVYAMFKHSESTNEEINKNIQQIVGKRIEKENFIAMSKKAGELRFENGSKDKVSTILLSILQMWKQHVMYLNNEENRYLAELRDALLPDLMSGKITLE